MGKGRPKGVSEGSGNRAQGWRMEHCWQSQNLYAIVSPVYGNRAATIRHGEKDEEYKEAD